jgi:hypothetical protein
MSSRQEEKEQRKQERLEREAAAAKTAKRKRLLQLIGGVAVACAIIAAVVFAVGSGGGDGDDVDDTSLGDAAKQAGCTYRSFPDEGQEHTADKLTVDDFDTNPPTSGQHNPTPAPDGIYAPGNEPALENWVHTLEHGRIILQYKPGTPTGVVSQLTTLFNEDVADSGGAYHMVLMQNNSKMQPQVAAVAWRHYMSCNEFTPAALDAFRSFRDALVDKAPEQVP